MNKKIDSSFDRVEKALGTLIDSIAKYNPSTSQVEELGNADAELTKGLKDLQTHQFNYQRILDLRSETAKYDAQIKDTLRLLANTRKELVHASATAFPDGPNYKIQYDELLSYAGRISRTTIPPVGAVNAISAGTTESSQLLKGEASAPETAATTPAAETPNGVATPQPTQPLSVTANGDGGGGGGGIADSQLSNATTANTTGTGTELPEGLATFLNPHSAYTFVPWPTEEQVRHGAVAALAYLAEQGIEAEGYDPAAEKAREEREAEERRAAEERERADREERERRLREEHARARDREDKERAEAWRRASVSAGAAAAAAVGSGAPAAPPPPQPKAQFQFMGDDDDDDDD
ncbi:vitamin-D-receptor interacting mediator subunit 4-domain-containing protein [Hypoxylon argillaceum]|nr:vitamin-D-receptor interacting mediator subunit 4-domain-containing protein [Hypoxylon argillaceum]